MKTKFYQNDINAYHNEIYIENELININKKIDLFKKLMDNNDLPFEEYIKDINRLYNIQISDNDLYRICFYIFGSTPSSIILNTNITYTVTRQIQNNNNFSYTNEDHSLYIKVAYVNNDLLDSKHIYSIEEISALSDNKDIVILEYILDEESDNYCNDEIVINNLSPLNSITSNNFNNIKYINGDYIDAIYNFLKDYFTTSKLKKDLSLYIETTKDKLITLENYINTIINNYSIKIKQYNKISKEICRIKEKK